MVTLTVGDKVVYPGRGPCLVSAVVRKVVCGTEAKFYRLILLDESQAELFVPVNHSQDSQMRALLERSDIPRLLGRLKGPAGATDDSGTPKNWRQRQLDNSKLITSGSIFDLADRVKFLTRLSGTKTLGMDERNMLYRARKLLACEIAEVLNESKHTAEARIDSALGVPQHDEPFTNPRQKTFSA
jgi:RNA polymerase-interacting CarD/CdnL/TRCF family regulator